MPSSLLQLPSQVPRKPIQITPAFLESHFVSQPPRIRHKRLDQPARRIHSPSPQLRLRICSSQFHPEQLTLRINESDLAQPYGDVSRQPQIGTHAGEHSALEGDEIMHRRPIVRVWNVLSLDELDPSAGFDQGGELLHGEFLKLAGAGQREALVHKIERGKVCGGPGVRDVLMDVCCMLRWGRGKFRRVDIATDKGVLERVGEGGDEVAEPGP